jgi:hypothetical protein
MKLHQWATMAARALATARMVKLMVSGKEKTIQNLYPQASHLAEAIRSRTEAFKLTRALFQLLPDTLRQMRQIRGSPSERLFWILVNLENVGELCEIISVDHE